MIKTFFPSGGLSRKLIVAIVLFSSAITLVITVLQLHAEYEKEINSLNRNFDKIKTSYVESMSKAVWFVDDEQINLQLAGMLQGSDIVYSTVDVDGKIRWKKGVSPTSSSKTTYFPLTHVYNGTELAIGMLQVSATLENIYGRILDRVLVILLSNAFKTFLVAGFMMVIFHQLVTRHLQALARHNLEYDFSRANVPFVLGRAVSKSEKKDELDQLVDAVNYMHANLQTSYKELIDSKLECETANKVKTEFLANMSHELRTPLNAIMGFSEAMKTQMFGPMGNEKYAEYANDIYHSGKHLLDLINDILDVSTLELGDLELNETQLNVSQILAAAKSFTLSRAEARKVRIIHKIDSPLPALYADQLRLKQILINLVSNAIKFAPEGSEVTVAVRMIKDGSLSFAVTDTGIGMSKDDIALSMEPFGRTDKTQVGGIEGVGLGIPLAMRLVEAHGGAMNIESNPNTGTTVTFNIPAERVISQLC